MLISTAITSALSLASLGAASSVIPRNAGGMNGASRGKLYARAQVLSADSSIEAHVEFWGRLDGTPTFVKVEVLKGLFDDQDNTRGANLGGPYAYHVHTNPVGKGRNCTQALGHLDPLLVSESLVCDPAFPQYCQEGDLSGKHGKLNGTASGAISTFGYSDDYLRFFPADFSILGRSVVIHSSNKTRLACGDIISTLDGTANSQLSPTYKKSNFVKNYPTGPPFNPPQVVTPFVGTNPPNNTDLFNLPFPLPNAAIPLYQSLNVKLDSETKSVMVNGSSTTATLPVERSDSTVPPFKGYMPPAWSWD